ncbi:MAG: hypothetical protein B7Z66_07690 [Chromatiales bacterium 21-64-14]|nr:MAG: hypothetical protein B7Z66_07690 [Chromatiales bacterium 21-64-14]HQU15937.1 efflux RND transporter periplasmic adaptor subunit [Gammaproteobacteria bacterium]
MRVLVILAMCLAAAPAWAGDGDWVPVQQRTLTTQYRAYAQIQPIGSLTVHALLDGTLSGFHLVPGTAVRNGQLLARLTGPGFAAARSAVAGVHSELVLAQKRLASVRRTYPALSSRNELAAAQVKVNEARQQLQAARARLVYLESGAVIRAPGAGRVIETFVVDGEQVARGAPLLRLQAQGGLWIKGVFYGADAAALTPGMHGTFTPADGGTSFLVTVRSVLDPVRPDGGRAVGCEPDRKSAGWVNGQAGTLVLDGAPQRWLLVPTGALIMRAGTWWVLAHDAQGERRVQVTPGPESGAWTAVRGDLRVGAPVAVNGAYGRFHRDFSHHFQNPD